MNQRTAAGSILTQAMEAETRIASGDPGDSLSQRR